jgi:hypothetical protein
MAGQCANAVLLHEVKRGAALLGTWVLGPAGLQESTQPLVKRREEMQSNSSVWLANVLMLSCFMRSSKGHHFALKAWCLALQVVTALQESC